MSVDLQKSVESILDGGVVVAATETLFGLLCDASNGSAVRKIISLKGRDEGKTFPLIAPSTGFVKSLALKWNEECERLAAKHWPGPLTLVLPVEDIFFKEHSSRASIVRNNTIALRVAGSSPATSLCEATNRLLVSTSANTSGMPARKRYGELEAIFQAEIGLSGDAPGGIPSTIYDPFAKTVLRAGAVDLL